MGPDETSPWTYVAYITGEKVTLPAPELPALDIPTLDIPDLNTYEDIYEEFHAFASFLYAELSRGNKRLRCRNQKRFVKLAMSDGLDRNRARFWAKMARSFGNSYQEVWTRHMAKRILAGKEEGLKWGKP